MRVFPGVGAKLLLTGMIAASVSAVAWGARDRAKAATKPPVAATPEATWLSRDAAREIVGEGGTLGPLFADLEFGEAVAPDVRHRIVEFARENDVAIDLEMDHGVLGAIRFQVEYGGCCGYEEADLLALRANHGTAGGGCFGPTIWLSEWAHVNEEQQTFVRARLDVNRLTLRWTKAITIEELLERADALVGADVGKPIHPSERRVAGRYIEQPFGAYPYRSGRFIDVTAKNGHNAEVTIDLSTTDIDLASALKERWGRPRVTPEREDSVEMWTWTKRDRVITAHVFGHSSMLVSLTAR